MCTEPNGPTAGRARKGRVTSSMASEPRPRRLRKARPSRLVRLPTASLRGCGRGLPIQVWHARGRAPSKSAFTFHGSAGPLPIRLRSGETLHGGGQPTPIEATAAASGRVPILSEALRYRAAVSSPALWRVGSGPAGVRRFAGTNGEGRMIMRPPSYGQDAHGTCQRASEDPPAVLPLPGWRRCAGSDGQSSRSIRKSQVFSSRRPKYLASSLAAGR